MTESVILLAHFYAAGAHCSDQGDLSTEKYTSSLSSTAPWQVTFAMSLALALCILIICSLPTPESVLEHTQYSRSSRARAPSCFCQSPSKQDFPHWDTSPWKQRSVPVCSLKWPKHLAQCLVHRRPLITFPYWRDCGPAAESQADSWPHCFPLHFLILLPSFQS